MKASSTPSEESKPTAFCHVLAQLDAADRVWQREAAACSVLRGALALGVLVVLAWAADVFLHLGPAPRLALDGFWVLALLGIVSYAHYRVRVAQSGAQRTARRLESAAPELGSQLINVLQLQEQVSDARLGSLTHELARQAVKQYAEELSGRDLVSHARTDSVRRAARRTAFGFLVGGLVLLALHEITATEFARFLDPFGDHPPYSLTRLEIVDPGAEGVQVVYGQGVMVSVEVSGHRPGELFLTATPVDHPEAAFTLPMFDKGVRGFSNSSNPSRAICSLWRTPRTGTASAGSAGWR
jgi:hypothetical protein